MRQIRRQSISEMESHRCSTKMGSVYQPFRGLDVFHPVHFIYIFSYLAIKIVIETLRLFCDIVLDHNHNHRVFLLPVGMAVRSGFGTGRMVRPKKNDV